MVDYVKFKGERLNNARTGKDKTLGTVVYSEVTQDENGEIVKEKYTTKENEPAFVKLYLDQIFAVKGLNTRNISFIFIAILRECNGGLGLSYANANDDKHYGGEIVFINDFVKKNIIRSMGISMSTFNNAMSALVKQGFLKRVARCTYQVNPNIIGRGKWTDIECIRANWEFNDDCVSCVTEITRRDSETDFDIDEDNAS